MTLRDEFEGVKVATLLRDSIITNAVHGKLDWNHRFVPRACLASLVSAAKANQKLDRQEFKEISLLLVGLVRAMVVREEGDVLEHFLHYFLRLRAATAEQLAFQITLPFASH